MKASPNNKEHDEYAAFDGLIGLCETDRIDASIRHDAIIYASEEKFFISQEFPDFCQITAFFATQKLKEIICNIKHLKR